MGMVFTIVGLLLLITGGIGMFVTTTGFSPGSPEWLQGVLTFGAFLGIALTIIVWLVVVTWEGD